MAESKRRAKPQAPVDGELDGAYETPYSDSEDGGVASTVLTDGKADGKITWKIDDESKYGVPLKRDGTMDMRKEIEKDLDGQVIVITGASSGFGRGVALELGMRGATLVLAARRDRLLSDLVRECEAYNCKAVSVPTDVTKKEDVESLARRAVVEFGHIDVWINDAGVGALGRFDEIPLEDHVRVVEITLLGVIHGSYYAMKQFRSQGHGTLINVASLLGKVPSPYYASYTAAKHGVVGLSGVLRQELRTDGIEDIHVCTVMPGEFHTPFFEHAANYTGHDLTPTAPFHDPRRVVETIVALVKNPEDEVVVGSGAKHVISAHKIASKMTERRMEKGAKEIDGGPFAPSTQGSLYEPVMAGAGVVADTVMQ